MAPVVRCDGRLAGPEVTMADAPAWVRTLDAAVMLALLFNSEAFHAELAPRAVDRLREVHQRLSRELSRL
jgi:hypothetical protein